MHENFQIDNKSKVLAIVPARGGSKRIFKKNMQKIGDSSLVSITLNSAINSGIFSKIILSSDDQEILSEADSLEQVTPLKREAELSSDQASSIDLVVSILNLHPEFEYVCLLQPTSPFRNAEHILKSYQTLVAGHYDNLVSVKNVQTNPFHIVVKSERSVKPLIDKNIFDFQTQSTPEMFCLNGGIYFSKIKNFLKNRSFVGLNTGLYLMSEIDSIDIDTQEDLNAARNIYLKSKKGF